MGWCWYQITYSNLEKLGFLMDDVKMDYLNDADSMYVDSEVTWFWQFRCCTAGFQNVGQRGVLCVLGASQSCGSYVDQLLYVKTDNQMEKREQGE